MHESSPKPLCGTVGPGGSDALVDSVRSRAGRAQRLLRHVRARHRLRPRAAARGDGQGREPRRRAGAEARRGPDRLPLDRAGRHHADRHLRRRLLRRDPVRAAGRRAARGIPALAEHRRHARLRARRRRHHLRLADHRRTGPEAARAAQRRGDRRLRLGSDDGARRRRRAGRLVPPALDRGRPRPASAARRRAERGHRGGGEGDDRRGHRRRRLPRGGARTARRRHPLRRPAAAHDHGAAARHGLDRRERPFRGGARRSARFRPLAFPALRRLDRRGDRLRPCQGPAGTAPQRRPRPASGGSHAALRQRVASRRSG